MARNERGRVNFSRQHLPQSRNGAAAEGDRRVARKLWRAQRWRKRFRHFALGSFHSSRIVQGICDLFRMSADAARMLRAATGSQIVSGNYGRHLHVEGLEVRQLLSTTPWSLDSQGNFSQNWSNQNLITANDDWSGVPSIVGYRGDNLAGATGVDPQTVLAPGIAPTDTPAGVVDVNANQTNPAGFTTGGVAEFTKPAVILSDNFEYSNQAAFEANWATFQASAGPPPVNYTSAILSTDQAASPTKSIQFPGTTSNNQNRNQRSFTETSAYSSDGVLGIGDQIIWSFDFYDSAPAATPQRNHSNLQDSTAPTGTNQLVAMGFNNNQNGANSGGQFYMARILGYNPGAAADPDGGPVEQGTLGSGAFFKLNDFGVGQRSLGWHNLKVIISTNDGLSTDYEFFVDNVLAERVSDVGNAASIRSYDVIRIGSGLSNGSTAAFVDNMKLEYATPGQPYVALQGSATARAPFLNMYMNSASRNNVSISYNLRDIDGAADNSAQPVALQYRIGGSGDFINVPAAFVADASSGPSLSNKVTAVTASMPEWSGESDLQFRVLTTDASGSDEWIAVDDILITSTPITTVYTNAAWSSFSYGQIITDADPDTPGNQSAKFGVDAFATITASINAVAPGGTVKIAPGIYNENVDATSKSVVLSPGASPGQVTINGDFILNSDDTLAIEINGTNPATQFDNFLVDGNDGGANRTMTLGGATLALTGTYLPLATNSFTIISNDNDGPSTDPVNGAFAGLAEGSRVLLNNFPLVVSYVGGDGNDVSLSLPQPSDVWVNDTWIITNDLGTPGLSYGDTVMSNTAAGDDSVVLKNFGYNAFSTINPAVAAVTVGGAVHVLAGTVAGTSTINKNVSILGEDATGDLINVNAGGSPGVTISDDTTVNIDNIHFSGFGFAGIGIDVKGTLNLTNSVVDGGLIGINVDGTGSFEGKLTMSSSRVINATVVGLNVGGDSAASATVDHSAFTVAAGATADIHASDGSIDVTSSTFSTTSTTSRAVLATTNGDISVTQSDLSGVAGSVAVTNATTSLGLDASANWWGTASETAVFGRTEGAVDITPYLEAGTNAAIIGFQGDFSHLHVTALGTQTAGGRINEAVGYLADGALTGAGRIIDVHAGTYIENATINKSVQLRGANFGADPTDGGLRGLETVVQPGSGDVMAVFADDVSIDGFTLANGGTGVYSEASDNTTIRNNIISGVTYAAFFDSAAASVTTGGVVDKNLIQALTGAQTFGVLSFNASYVSVTDNDMTGVDVGVYEQYFYQPNGGLNANNVVSGNEITAAVLGYGTNERSAAAATTALSNNVYQISSGGTGIELLNIYKPGGITLTNETISGASFGVYAFVNGGSVSITGGSIAGDGTVGSTGVQITNYLSAFTFPANVGNGDIAIDSVDISGFKTGVFVEDHASGAFAVHATITNDTDITGADTGILVSGSAASADITDNDASIHGNSIGIDVNGGTATITGNHIYNNTTGVRLTAGGSATVNSNDFEGGGSADNGTDLLLTSSAGNITGGTMTGNTFAGTTYIRNESPQNITALRTPAGTNSYNVAGVATTDDFAIENRVYHKIDNVASGLVTWVANTIFVTPATSPTASDNDYTRIKNAIEAAADNGTINLLGTFNWVEPNAAASWALGNNGTSGDGDDYSILAPQGLEGVTLTAPGGLGTAAIQGPGDLPTVNLESFLQFAGSASDALNNQDWTISNLTILDFDLSIGMFSDGADPSLDQYDGTTITNNRIRIANDLNGVVAPADVNQNIGIHYAFGDGQTISGNQIEIPGDGISDPSADLFSNRAAFSSVVGIQSNTNGAAYDDLLITGNLITVLNAQDATNPQRIIGIWENGNAIGLSDITVSNNQFINAAPGNDPTLNLQQAFWVTSQSGTGIVTYSGNSVTGASVGIKWAGNPEFPTQNYAGLAAVNLTNNTLNNVETGILVQNNGSANLSANTLTNSGSMLGQGVGVSVTSGSTVNIDGSPAENTIIGFATGITSAGTLTVVDNDASIHGNTTGIDVTGGTATISGNHVYDNTTGIRFRTSGSGSVTDNNFDGGAGDDNGTDLLLDSSAGAVTIGAGNDFAGDTFYVDNQSTQSYDLSSNGTTFDETDNFRIEDKMHHRVDTDLPITNGLVTWVADNVYVTTPGVGSTDSSIQRGVDAVPLLPGWTVNIEDGTYAEQVSIAKDLTLKGESQAGAIVQAPAALSLINSFAYAGTTRQSVIAVTGGTVTVEDLTVDGAGSGATVVPGNDFHGIGIHNADVTVDSVTVTRVRDASLTGAQRGRAIFAGNDAGTHTVAVTGSTVSDYQKSGIDLRGAGLTDTITNNVVTGAGPTAVIAQNGIVFVSGTVGTISGNTVTNNAFTSTGAVSVGILLSGAGAGTAVSNNLNVNNNQVGIATNSDATISGNQITGSSSGGIRVDSGSVSILSNTVTTSGAGLRLNGGNIKVQSNVLNGNTIGALIQNTANADLGTGGGPDYTGLGASTGGNDFSGYTATATATSGAIVDLKPDAVAGQQGAPPDVEALGNLWAVNTPNAIENVVWHDNDVSTLGFVDFFTFAFSGNVTVSDNDINEGDSVTVSGSFTNVPQPHTVTVDWGDGSVDTVISLPAGTFSFTSPSHTYEDDADGPPMSTVFPITVTIEDASMDTITDTSQSVTVNNVAPTVLISGPTTAGNGQTLSYSFTTTDPGEGPGDLFTLSPITTTSLSGGAAGTVSNVVFNPSTGSGTFDVTFSSPPGVGSVQVSVTVSDDDTASGTDTHVVTVGNTLRVTNFVTNDSGFDVTFNRAVDMADVNLYDQTNPLITGDTLRAPDLVVHASVANVDVTGSVRWNAATNTLSWVKTGGVLQGNETYTVTLVSGDTAFEDTFGNDLDGNSDFTPGDNYSQSFAVGSINSMPIVSLPDFARGPGQGVDLTANSTVDVALPVRATGLNVQGVNFELIYDTALLQINGGLPGVLPPAAISAVRSGWTVIASQTVDLNGIATLSVAVFTSNPLTAFTGTENVVNLVATVPSSAAYGASQILRLANSEVNNDTALDDAAFQKVAFVGDANGSGILPSSSPPNAYTAEDSTLIARVVVAAMGATGFRATPLVDPAIVGDASGNGSFIPIVNDPYGTHGLNAFDASLVLQEAGGINTPEVPDETAPGSGGFAALDPQLSIPDNTPMVTGHTVVVPVNITIEPTVTGILSSTFTVDFEPDNLKFISADKGADFNTGNWAMSYSLDAPGDTLTVAIASLANPSGNNGGLPQELAKLTFFAQYAADLGTSPLTINPVDPNENGLVWTKDDGSASISRLLGDYNFDRVVDGSDYVIWRKQSGTSVPPFSGADGNGDGSVGPADYQIWRQHYGDTSPGAGSGSAVVMASAATVDPPAQQPAVTSASLDAASSTEFAELVTSTSATTSGSRVEHHSARDEALRAIVESPSVVRKDSRSTRALVSKAGAGTTAGAQHANDLLFDVPELVSSTTQRAGGDAFHKAGQTDADEQAVDALFADLDCGVFAGRRLS